MYRVLHALMQQVEELTSQELTIEQALDLIEAVSHDFNEKVLINVARESFSEIMNEWTPAYAQAA